MPVNKAPLGGRHRHTLTTVQSLKGQEFAPQIMGGGNKHQRLSATVLGQKLRAAHTNVNSLLSR